LCLSVPQGCKQSPARARKRRKNVRKHVKETHDVETSTKARKSFILQKYKTIN
jgi:hypothetical protein